MGKWLVLNLNAPRTDSNLAASSALRVAPGQPYKARCQILAIEGQARHAALSDQTAAIEHQQIVIGLDLIEQVSGPEHAHALVTAERSHMLVECLSAGRVEACTGLVEQQQLGAMQQRAGDLDASAVTAVEFTHLAAAPFAELLALQLEFDAFIRQGPRHAVQGGVVAQVLLDGQVQVQRALLEHHAEAGERLARRLAQTEAGDAHFEQAVFADELSAQSVQALRPLIAAQWAGLFERLAPALEQHLAADRAEGRTQDQRVRIGFYSYAAPMVGASTPEPAPAPP